MFISASIARFKRRYTPLSDSEISVNWHQSNNFGDVLSKYIAEKLSGKRLILPKEPHKESHFMITGSLLSLTTKKSILWGVGIASRKDKINFTPKQTVMIRGKYSEELVRNHGAKGPLVLGDPGYMMSKIYIPHNISKRYRLGVIPHWVDYELACHIFAEDDDIKVINLLNNDIEHVINEIFSCELCISSSLHGLIVAHSYEIPCLHVSFSDDQLQTGLKKYEIQGDGIKYWDYFSSVNIKEYNPLNINQKNNIDTIIKRICPNVGNLNQIEKIYESCPFKE